MKPEDYPPQEPVSDFAREYNRHVLEIAAEIGGAEENYGPDPYQSVLCFPVPEPDGNVFVMIHGGRLRPPGSQPGLRRPGRPLGGQGD